MQSLHLSIGKEGLKQKPSFVSLTAMSFAGTSTSPLATTFTGSSAAIHASTRAGSTSKTNRYSGGCGLSGRKYGAIDFFEQV